MNNPITRYLNAAFDLLLPRRCIVCGRKLLVGEKYLCLYCLADFPFTHFWKMRNNPMSDRFNSVLQNGLEKSWEEYPENVARTPREQYVYAASLFFYRSEAAYRHIPYQVKYHGNISAGKYFGQILGQKLSEAGWSDDIDVIVPVPLHWRRKWSRGYNQAEIIASGVAESLGVPLRTDILKRIRHTGTQTKLNISEKASNVADAFKATGPSEMNARHILLIDDVFTTGATLHACYEALRSVFPPSVRISIATLGFVGHI